MAAQRMSPATLCHLLGGGAPARRLPRSPGHAASCRGHPTGASRGLHHRPAREVEASDCPQQVSRPWTDVLRVAGGGRRDPRQPHGADESPRGSRRSPPPVLRETELQPPPRGLRAGQDLRRAAKTDAILRVFMDTGVRRGELLGLKLRTLDLDQGLLRVTGKGSRTRMVPVGARTVRLDRPLPAGQEQAPRRHAPRAVARPARGLAGVRPGGPENPLAFIDRHGAADVPRDRCRGRKPELRESVGEPPGAGDGVVEP